MRIISKFKDYYDGAQGYGIDKELVYVRKTEDTEDEKINLDRDITSHMWNAIDAKLMIVCVAGKNYPFLKLSIGRVLSKHDGAIAYSAEEVLSWLKLVKKESENAEAAIKNFEKPPHVNFFGDYSLCRQSITALFDEIRDNQFLADIGVRHHCPIILYDYKQKNRHHTLGKGITQSDHMTTVTLNPCLKDYGFQRVMDSYTMFQEISMYLGGVLPRASKLMVEITDDIKLHKHGFDKWTFRKQSKKQGVKIC